MIAFGFRLRGDPVRFKSRPPRSGFKPEKQDQTEKGGFNHVLMPKIDSE
jgi:hypothetical protein